MCEMNSNNNGRDEARLPDGQALPRRSSQSAGSKCPFCGDGGVFDEILKDKMQETGSKIQDTGYQMPDAESKKHKAERPSALQRFSASSNDHKGVKVFGYEDLEDEDIEEIMEDTAVTIVMVGMN